MSRLGLPDLAGGRQGHRRRIQVATVAHLDIVVVLMRAGMSAIPASDAARALMTAETGDRELSPALALRYDRTRHDADVAERLGAAAERVIERRRGRPAKRAGTP